MRSRYVFLTLMIGVPLALGAQVINPALPVDSGREVRVTTIAEQLRGHLLARYDHGDPAVHLCQTWNACGARGDSTGRRVISVREIFRLEVRQGDHGMTGFVVGAVTGGLLGADFVNAMYNWSGDAGPRTWPTIEGALAGAVSIGFLGGMIGTRYPKWSRVR